VEDIINSLGMGYAQVVIIALAFGVWFADGVELAFTVALTPAISKDLMLDGTQRATLASLVFCGMGFGCGVGGVAGDRFGRRYPILCGYLAVAAAQLTCSCITGFEHLAFLRFCLGVGMGTAMPPSLALTKEFCPENWRVFLMGLRATILMLGEVLGASMVYADDPYLVDLHWRYLLALGAIPPAIIGCLALAFLRESPVYLDNCGCHSEAKSVLEWVRLKNNASEAVEYPSTCTADSEYGSTFTRMRSRTSSVEIGLTSVQVLVGRHLAFSTAVLFLLCFTLNLIEYGTAYAEPTIFLLVSSPSTPGRQLVTKYGTAAIVRTLMLVPTVLLGRRSSVKLGLASIFFGLVIFVMMGSLQAPGHPGLAFIYRCSLWLQVAGVSLVSVPLYILSVEIYPVALAATGSAISVGGGRIGSTVAPFLFESMKSWQHFYLLLAAMSALGLLLFSLLPDPQETKELADADLQLVGAETEPLTKQ